MKLMPIGTVIKLNDIKLLVIGYTARDTSKGRMLGYQVISYPMGFLEQEKVLFVPFSAPFEVIAKGYQEEKGQFILERFGYHLEEFHCASDKQKLIEEQYRSLLRWLEKEVQK